jgi:hypothetical protein
MVNTQTFVDHVFSLSPSGGMAKCHIEIIDYNVRKSRWQWQLPIRPLSLAPNWVRGWLFVPAGPWLCVKFTQWPYD